MYSKQYQTQQRCRLRPKLSQKNKTDRAVKDNDYLAWMKEQPFRCFHCDTFYDIEIHHIKRDSTDRKRDNVCIAICHEHHTGSHEFSIHGTPRMWREKYSMEVQELQAAFYYEMYLKEKVL